MADVSTIPLIGPEHHGTRMTLDEFARAEGRPGYLYELEKGTIVVVYLPGLPHGRLVRTVMRAFENYEIAHPGRINYIGGGGEAGLRMPDLQSERHPDVSVYLTPPPTEDDQPWSEWAPEIAIEVVSAGSEERDYRVKREEYLRAGVRLYWIIDPHERSATVLRRRMDTWQEQRFDESGKLTTPLLPGFELALAELFPAKAP